MVFRFVRLNCVFTDREYLFIKDRDLHVVQYKQTMITFVNPVISGRQCYSEHDKYCEPLLRLKPWSGIPTSYMGKDRTFGPWDNR